MNNEALSAAYARGADAVDARTTFNIDRNQYLPSSEAGGCIRKAWYTRHQPDSAAPQEWGFARRGKHMETYITECLRAANVPLLHAGAEQVSLVCEATRTSATPDGAIVDVDAGTARGVEFKSIDPRTNVANLPRPNHVVQLQVAMALMHMHYGYEFSDGVLMYVDASDYDKRHLFTVPYNPDALTGLASRAKRVLDTRLVDSLDREGVRGGKKECRYCPFAQHCLGETLEAPTSQSPTRANRGYRLATTVAEYWTVKTTVDLGKHKLDELKETITTELNKRKTKKVAVDGYLVTLRTSPGRKTFDKRGAFKRHPDLVEFEDTGKPFDTLKIEQAK